MALGAPKGERWTDLEKEYGKLRAIWPYYFGEKKGKDNLTEREPKLPWYANALIYVTSFAAGVVSGSADLIAIGQGVAQHDWVKFAVASLLFGALLLMVAGMDKSLARTIPRIDILRKRREWGLWWECIAYSSAVGVIEITTLTILILNENKISEILKGQPLIAVTSAFFVILALGRAIMTFWTIVHSHLVNEALPVQLSTAKREGAELFGGELMRRIRALRNQKNIRLGKIMENFLLFLEVDPKAPKTGQDQTVTDKKGVTKTIKYDRLTHQATLTKEHHMRLITALDELETLFPSVIISAVSNTSTSSQNNTDGLLSKPGAESVEPGDIKKPITGSEATFSGSDNATHTPENSQNTAVSNTANSTPDNSISDQQNEELRHDDQAPLSNTEESSDRISGSTSRATVDQIAPLHALSNIWNEQKLATDLIDGGRTPDSSIFMTRLNGREITSLFGVSDRTFTRRWEDSGGFGIAPRFDDGKDGKRFRLGDVLHMYETGVFDGLSNYFSTYISQEDLLPVTNGNGHHEN